MAKRIIVDVHCDSCSNYADISVNGGIDAEDVIRFLRQDQGWAIAGDRATCRVCREVNKQKAVESRRAQLQGSDTWDL